MPLSNAKRVSHRLNMRRRYQGDPVHREKQKARSAVTRAVSRGKLFKGACEVCGDLKVHAHHDDYAKPMVVRWLCQAHHEELHGGAGYHG